MNGHRLRIDKLIDQKIEDRHRRIVQQHVEGYVTLPEVVRDVMGDAKFSKHLASRSGSVWEDELVWARYISRQASTALRQALGHAGRRQWESYVVPRSGSVARHIRWVPVAVMTLFEIKRSAAQKIRAGSAILAEGRYLQRLAIECEARGITDQMPIWSVYEEASEAANDWSRRKSA